MTNPGKSENLLHIFLVIIIFSFIATCFYRMPIERKRDIKKNTFIHDCIYERNETHDYCEIAYYKEKKDLKQKTP